MKPTLTPDLNKRTCSTIISASCAIWHGPDLDCIDTCAGDSMVDVTVKLASKICTLEDTLDLTTLQLDCLSDSCTGCGLCSDSNKTLKNILECIIKKYCLLKTQVDNLPTTGGSDTTECPTTFNVDIDCVENLAGRTLSTSPTNNEILQLIADALCISYESLLTRIDQLNIDLISCCNGSGSGTGTIPQVNSSCLFVGLKDIDEAYLLLDSDYCSLKTVIGDYSDLSSSLNPSGPCSTTINSYLTLTIGSATTLDESLTNIYSVLCALVTKVQEIEEMQTLCCNFNCDDISIVILGEVTDVDAKLVDLVFTFNGATSLVGYTATDSGSSVTFTDKNGSFITYSVDIFDSGTFTDLDLTGLDLSGNITVTGNLKYSVEYGTETYNCNKCISAVITINTDCAVCALTLSGGTSVSVKITYEYDGETSVILITSNGSYFIPKGATITSIVDESGSPPVIVSDCPNLVIPTPATLKCWRFAIPEHLFINGTENDAGEFYITGLVNGGVRYSLAAPGVVPSHLGVKGTDYCTSCPGYTAAEGAMSDTEALTSLTGYVAGGITYLHTDYLSSYVTQLNNSIGSNNPTVKEFASACTNSCDTCMTYRFLHLKTYSSTAPYLELTSDGAGSITVVIQIEAEQINTNCFCEGE